MKAPSLKHVGLLGLLLLITGCSSFHREWRTVGATSPASQGLEGAWDGTWLSDHNGHTGRLRAIITRLNEKEYHARFHASYLRVLSFGQAVNLRVRKDGTNFVFAGEADLGKAYGGVYSYEGSATAYAFKSTYKCSIDFGTFRMERPE